MRQREPVPFGKYEKYITENVKEYVNKAPERMNAVFELVNVARIFLKFQK